MISLEIVKRQVQIKKANPEERTVVDPRWKEITPDEALGVVADAVSKVGVDNPEKLLT